jgi:hypothetical protein
MKTIFVLLAVAGLSGCAVYPVPVYEPYGMGPVYGAPPPVVFYGSGVYRQGGYPDVHPPGYIRPRPGVLVQPAPWPLVQAPHPGHRARDRDGDGIPDRVDRDRDGDGIPDRLDRRPNDPRFR